LVDVRSDKARQDNLASLSRTSLEDLQERLLAGEAEELVVVLKGDVHGSVEATAESLEKLSGDLAKVKVLHKGVGGITENDVMLAAASNAIVLGFNVQPDNKAKEAAKIAQVDVRTYRVIYELLDEVKQAMEGLLAPDRVEVELGTAQVREVFKVSKVGQIAGCMVTKGKITRNARARLLRDQVVVFEGDIASLKRFKDDAKEVKESFECGISLVNFNDIKVDDVIEAYVIEERKRTL